MNKKQKLTPIFSQIYFLHHTFQFLKAKDLNIIKLVCKDWYEYQKNNYFIQIQTKNLNLQHDKIILESKGTQIFIYYKYLGYKQGEEIIYWNNKDLLMILNNIVTNPLKIVKTVNDNKFILPPIFHTFTNYIKSIVNYKNNKKHDKIIDYFKPNTKLQLNTLQQTLQQTLQNTESTLQNVDNTLQQNIMQIGHFKEGKKHGEFIKYFKNLPNQVERQCFYLENKLDGPLIEYKLIKTHNNLQNTLQQNNTLQNNTLQQNQFEAILECNCNYKNGKLNGEKKVYKYFQTLQQNILTDIINYKDGKLNGLKKHWEQQQLKKNFKKNFKKNLKKNLKENLKKNNFYLEYELNYENDKLNGECIYYYSNGSIFRKVEYDKGKMVKEIVM
ncbi:hypothetical protein ABK040_001426 [Willaertia magna]